jgi:2-alkenal reductase
MYEITPRPKRSSRLPLILGVLLVGVIVTGCMLTTAGVVVLGSSASARARQEPNRVAFQALPTPSPTPRARIVIEPPTGGIDYESAVLRNIYEQVNPSVVNVTVWIDHPPIDTGDATPEGQEGIMPFVNGSGFVWDGAGHIVTNNHVVESAERVQVNFFDGTAAIAEVVGTDVDSDLAVLKIDPAGYVLVPVQRGNLDDIYVGMRVAAIGNPFGLQGTLTSGIISAIGRSIPARGNFSIPDSIQTDTAINPGNSGGPLLNERGEVIGVNAQIRSDSGSNSGVGFAIPIAIVERVVPELIKNGTYDHSYMGITGTTFSPTCSAEQGLPKELRGVMVGQVLGGSPADKAGLQGADRKVQTEFYPVCPREAGGDVITAIEGQPVTTFDTMLDYLMRYTSPGDTISLTVLQDGDVKELDLVLGARPRR